MKTVPLSKGMVAIVDDADHDRVSQHKWFYSVRGYAVRNVPNPKGIKRKWTMQTMHRFIAGIPDGVTVDHISGDKLDNRRENLRAATLQQNACNRGLTKRNTSGSKGVSWYSPSQKWRAVIAVNKKYVHIGHFTDKQEAIDAYAEAANRLHGEFART